MIHHITIACQGSFDGLGVACQRIHQRGRGWRPGDANGDGMVDVADLGVVGTKCGAEIVENEWK